MIDFVRSSEPLSPVRTIARAGGGTDIWLRKNIRGPLTEQSGEDFSSPFYEAEEAFLRAEGTVSAEDVEAAFDNYWDKAAEYDPHVPMPTDKERIAQLEEQNTMLTECLLEMSEIVYG